MADPLSEGSKSYQFDFSRSLSAQYLDLRDDTARFIRNTAEQMVDGRTTVLDRPSHYPLGGTPYRFYGSVDQRNNPSVNLGIEKLKFLFATEKLATAQMEFQRVGDTIQAQMQFRNLTGGRPRPEQVHGLFGVLLPYVNAMCEAVATWEQKPVVHAIRWSQGENPHWRGLLETTRYHLDQGSSTFFRHFLPSDVRPAKAVAFVRAGSS